MLMLLGLPIFALFFYSIWEARLFLSLLAILAMITWMGIDMGLESIREKVNDGKDYDK